MSAWGTKRGLRRLSPGLSPPRSPLAPPDCPTRLVASRPRHGDWQMPLSPGGQGWGSSQAGPGPASPHRAGDGAMCIYLGTRWAWGQAGDGVAYMRPGGVRLPAGGAGGGWETADLGETGLKGCQFHTWEGQKDKTGLLPHPEPVNPTGRAAWDSGSRGFCLFLPCSPAPRTVAL